MSENKTLKKIDKFLENLEEKDKKKKGKLPFLYQTEGYKEAIEEGRDEEYEKLFRKLAKKHGFDPEDVENLPKDKKKAFFDDLDKNWKAKKETD
jgi:hypothetical protein